MLPKCILSIVHSAQRGAAHLRSRSDLLTQWAASKNKLPWCCQKQLDPCCDLFIASPSGPRPPLRGPSMPSMPPCTAPTHPTHTNPCSGIVKTRCQSEYPRPQPDDSGAAMHVTLWHPLVSSPSLGALVPLPENIPHCSAVSQVLLASVNGHHDLIQILVEHGADINMKAQGVAMAPIRVGTAGPDVAAGCADKIFLGYSSPVWTRQHASLDMG